jgi:RNA polymerase sigma factor (sigma-70 family)
MSATKSKGRPRKTSPEMALYARQLAATNSGEHSRLKRNLLKAIREELTPRQREVLTLYYAGGRSAHEIADLLEVCPSTVFRTLKRAEKRLFRCLRYGAESYLLGMEEES